METPAHGNLIHLLTEYHFGAKVATVIRLLFNFDQASLKFLRTFNQDIEFEDLKKSLLILVKYQLVDYIRSVRSLGQSYEYSVVSERTFCFYRIPQFIRTTEKLEGKLTAHLLTLVSERGLICRTVLSESACKYSGSSEFNNTNNHDVETLIDSLIHRRFFVAMSNNICINLERYNRQHRDILIEETISQIYNQDPTIASICKAMLDISFENTSDDALITAPVPLTNLKNLLSMKSKINETILEKHLTRLSTETNNRFFVSSGNHPQKGPMYAINIGSIVDYLMKEHLCSVVTTRFGLKCCRVFRVLLQRGPILLRQLEEFIMLPTKDVREYSYVLIKEGFVRNRQVPKTLDNAPGKSVFIMSVELDQVVFKVADLCCEAISNILMRYKYELRCNQSLLSKAQAVRELASIETVGDRNQEGTSSCEVWNEYFNSHELSQLERTNKNLDRLTRAKNQIDETLFLAHIWLKLRPNLLN